MLADALPEGSNASAADIHHVFPADVLGGDWLGMYYNLTQQSEEGILEVSNSDCHTLCEK